MPGVTNEIGESVLSFEENMDCPYFKDKRSATIEYVIIGYAWECDFSLFLSKGYRRLGGMLYRSICDQCHACQPMRLDPDTFRISRSQKRTARKNRDIRVKISHDVSITPEKIALFRKYTTSKHQEEKKEREDYEGILRGIHYGFDNAMAMNYSIGNKLIGVGIIDKGKDALSSNYFYYDTDCLDRRLGIYSVLQEIFLAQHLRKSYYYLGYYIEENAKMSYKKFFRPNEIYTKGHWKAFLDG